MIIGLDEYLADDRSPVTFELKRNGCQKRIDKRNHKKNQKELDEIDISIIARNKFLKQNLKKANEQ